MFQLGQMEFDRLDIDPEWRKTVGALTNDFSCIIYGNSGNGKTTAILRFIQALCDCAPIRKKKSKADDDKDKGTLRATYVSFEEGISGTMQDAMRREGTIDNYGGRIVLAGNATLDGVIEYFSKRGSPDIVVLDSVDYCNLTVEQYKVLRTKLKKKIIVLISWSQGSKPKSQAAKDIEYMVDVKLFVKDFMIWPKSRYGGNEPYVIWEERAKLLQPKYFADRDRRCNQIKYASVQVAQTRQEREENDGQDAENDDEERGVYANN